MTHDRSIKQWIVFHLIKLPLILIMIITGFLLEFLIELPFMVMCKLDRIFNDQNPVRHRQSER